MDMRISIVDRSTGPLGSVEPAPWLDPEGCLWVDRAVSIRCLLLTVAEATDDGVVAVLLPMPQRRYTSVRFGLPHTTVAPLLRACDIRGSCPEILASTTFLGFTAGSRISL
jgi:hypothetical protein